MTLMNGGVDVSHRSVLVTVEPDEHHKAMMNQDKHLEIRIRVSMFGHFRFSYLIGILWESGAAERSEASTALVGRRFEVRYGGAKRGRYRFECPNARSGISMQTSEKSLRLFHGNCLAK